LGIQTIAVDDDFFNWDIAFTYDTSDEWSWFGRVANGSRGPVTLGRFGFTSSAETETSTSLEFGFKSTLLGGRARWNGAVYAFQNDDQQLTATGGVGNTNQLLNVDQVNGIGFETDLEILLTDDFLLLTNISYNDTEIDDPGLRDDLCGSNPTCTGLDPVVGSRVGAFGPVTEVSIDGNPLPRTPEWLFNVIAQYTVPMDFGSLYFNTDWNYRDESNIFLHESVEFVAEERWLGSIRFGYRNADENIDVAIVGRNITDEIVVDGALNFLNLTAFVNEPAFWGVEFRYDF
jgi:iron complex outermembrane receptor protein